MSIFDPQEKNDFLSQIEAHFGSAVAEFEIQKVPQGNAPLEIRKGWSGIVLPVREQLLEERGGRQEYFDLLSGTVKQNHDAVPVYGLDAVIALDESQRSREASYWLNSGLAFGTFIFRAHEGQLRPLVITTE